MNALRRVIRWRQVIAERERRKELRRRALRTGDFERAEKLVKEGRK